MPARQPKFKNLRSTTDDVKAQNPNVSHAAHWDYDQWADAHNLIRSPLNRTVNVLKQSPETSDMARRLSTASVKLKVRTNLDFKKTPDEEPKDNPCPGQQVCVNIVCEPDGNGGEDCYQEIFCN